MATLSANHSAQLMMTLITVITDDAANALQASTAAALTSWKARLTPSSSVFARDANSGLSGAFVRGGVGVIRVQGPASAVCKAVPRLP